MHTWTDPLKASPNNKPGEASPNSMPAGSGWELNRDVTTNDERNDVGKFELEHELPGLFHFMRASGTAELANKSALALLDSQIDPWSGKKGIGLIRIFG